MDTTYCIDPTKEVTPQMVRDAIVLCFYLAHSKQAEMGTDPKILQTYCTEIVRKAFAETDGDFDSPTKTSILATLPWLADFSKSFRDQSIIEQHTNEIKQLISRLKD